MRTRTTFDQQIPAAHIAPRSGADIAGDANRAAGQSGRHEVEPFGTTFEDDVFGIVARDAEYVGDRRGAPGRSEPDFFDISPANSSEFLRRQRRQVEPLGGIGNKGEGHRRHGSMSFSE
jgi:hypothetical protein